MGLNEVVARTLNLDVALVDSVLTTYSQLVLVAVVMQGPTATILGTLVVEDDSLVIADQNPRLRDLMRGTIRPEDVMAEVDRIIERTGA